MTKKSEAGGQTLILTVNDLKGKQSVRATFRLPPQMIELLGVIARQLGVKQKSLFDQLIENAAVLGQVAHKAREYAGAEEHDRRQKTFVISRNSLLSLNSIAKEAQIPRDLLVEISIKRLLPLIKTELSKHKQRKALLKEMREELQHEERLLVKAGNLLGEDDVVYEMINNQVSLARKHVAALGGIVERGMAMEEW